MPSVLLCLTGGVACYKAAEVARLLRRRGARVRAALTPAALRFVGAPTLRALCGRAPLVDEFAAPRFAHGMDHIAAARAADILLVAPASANFIAKAAAGAADNVVLAAWLAAGCRRVVAPAMNQQMWRAATTQRNLRALRADGAQILGPEAGEQACGEEGMGRLLAPERIVAALLDAPLAGKRVVVSTGATAEPLDAMRVISNRSSGQMGFAVAAACAELGAKVVVVAGQTAAPPPPAVAVCAAPDGEAMRRAVLRETENADWFFSVAAVADYRPVVVGKGKTPRQDGNIALQLRPTADILAEVCRRRPKTRCVGFAAQSGTPAQILKQARAKMTRKKTPYFVANDVACAGKDNCQLTLLYAGGEAPLSQLPKAEAARQLLATLLRVSHETAARPAPARKAAPARASAPRRSHDPKSFLH